MGASRIDNLQSEIIGEQLGKINIVSDIEKHGLQWIIDHLKRMGDTRFSKRSLYYRPGNGKEIGRSELRSFLSLRTGPNIVGPANQTGCIILPVGNLAD
jgi:hypothetical protein